MNLLRVERREFTGPAGFLVDDDHRAGVAEYFADLTRPFGIEADPEPSGQSYGEMARALVEAVVAADEPVGLLVLAFSMHDLWPGRATATFLSHLCPGTPLSFAICDQGGAAPFTALRVLLGHRPRRALLIALEQADLPYDSPVTPPARHRGVAMLYGDGEGSRVVGLRQHPDVAPESVPDLASRAFEELSAEHGGARLVLGDALAEAWPAHPEHLRAHSRQPTTGVWWHLADALTDPPGLVVLGDYDRDLRYLCLVGIEAR